jgi:predicted DsbA family dithiol-disulfide isomerase
MKVEIWSDFVSPLCSAAKQRFENALNKFEQKEKLKIVWHSVQIDAEMDFVPSFSLPEYAPATTGVSVLKRNELIVRTSQIAKEVGLKLKLDNAILYNAIINNSVDAQRLLHFANEHGLQNATREKLLTHFRPNGRNAEELEALVRIAQTVGLDDNEVRTMLLGDKYKQEVQQDQYRSKQAGAMQLPFFLFNDKYTVSGAQTTGVYEQLLAKIWEEEKPVVEEFAPFGFCSLEGGCF